MTYEHEDNLFVKEIRRMKLAAAYPKGKSRLPLKKRVDAKPNKKKPSRIVDVRVTIRDGAVLKRVIEIVYKKTTTQEVKTYRVAPYSYRYLRLRVGIRKMLFGWDFSEKHIKSFALRNIQSARLTNNHFTPKFPIEIGKKMHKTSLRRLSKK